MRQQHVSNADSWTARKTRWMNHYHARRAARARPPTGFSAQPEPRTIGTFGRGRQLLAGNFLFAGYLVQAPGRGIWDLTAPGQGFDEEIHGFTWLDDLAAVGDYAARDQAQTWLRDWLARYASGRGPGWSPDLTGRRLVRWINHAQLILSGQGHDMTHAFQTSLAQQTLFLSRRWSVASPGLPRFEALTGLIYAGLSLEAMEEHVDPAITALAQECEDQIDDQGGIPTRNPEELLEVFTLLNWAASALSEAGRRASNPHLAAIERIAPTLRSLRHADGSLARFHGGGRGLEGRLDSALASSGIKPGLAGFLSMGFAKLSAGRTTLIMDAASPPSGLVSWNAHASTLAFELTSGRRPLVVNCGSGISFGTDWRRAGRATPSHSTLGLEDYSSSRLGPRTSVNGFQRELLMDFPDDTRIEPRQALDGTGFVAGHNGYVSTHGLTHVRQIDLSADGRGIAGEDTLATITKENEAQFDRATARAGAHGCVFTIRFHLHPDVDVALDLGGTAVSMALKSGEIWVFRYDGGATLSLERSVFLEKGRLKPRAGKQVVLTGVAMDYATRIRWTLAKAQETPTTLRDLGPRDGATAE
jgi:uncharacterized heparinase superfamily protein